MFCENCGKQLSDVAKFCSDCGTKVADKEIPPIQFQTQPSLNTINSTTERISDTTAYQPPLEVNSAYTVSPPDAKQKSSLLKFMLSSGKGAPWYLTMFTLGINTPWNKADNDLSSGSAVGRRVAKEIRYTCLSCGNIWHSLPREESTTTKCLTAGLCSAYCPFVLLVLPAFFMKKNGMPIEHSRCKKCKSTQIKREEIEHVL